MSSSNKQYYAELTPYTLHVARTVGTNLEFCGACVIDQKAALEETLAKWTEGAAVKAVTAVAPAPSVWHLASRDEAAKYRTTEALRTFAAGLADAPAGPLEVAACNAEDGLAIPASGSGRWLLGATSAEALAATLGAAAERRLEISRPASVTLARIGGIHATVRSGGQVVLWDIGMERSYLILIGARGVEQVTPCAMGFDAIWSIVQTALGLKFRGAAARLFFNDTYDFNEAAPKIANELAPALKPALSAIAGASGTAFACVGVTAKQEWFVREVAKAVGLVPWAPELAKTANLLKLQVGADAQSAAAPDAIGVLRLAAVQGQSFKEWNTIWTHADSAATTAPAAVVVAPEKAAPPPPAVVIPSPVAKPEPAPKPVASPPPPPAPAPAPKPVVAVKPAPAPVPVKPAATPTASKPAGPAPVPLAIAAKGAAKQSSKSAPAPVTPKQTPPSSAKAAPLPAPAPVSAAKYGDSSPATPRKKLNYVAIGGIAAGLVFIGIAGKFYFDAQSAKASAQQERAAAAEQIRTAEAHAKQMEQQAKAEQERIRKEAEAARESAVALARQQAEEQTRMKISAELEADRIAHSPGILIVTTSPAGADVSIDGGPARKAPLSLNDIMPGAHRVAITLGGYDPVNLAADIKGTKTTDLGLIQLERATGTLTVNSTPDGVNFAVRMAGASAGSTALRSGRTPAQFDDLAPGDYVVTYTRDGWRDQTEAVTIAKRATAQSTAKFAGGAVFVTSVPVGATVKRAGVTVGTTPMTLTNVPAETVTYELTMAGYDSATVTGDVADGKQLRLSAEMASVSRIARPSEMKSPPQPLETRAPQVAPWAREQAMEVNVSYVVKRDGTVGDVQIVGKVDKDVAKACIDAVSKWKFRPAMGQNGQPINVRVAQPIKFAAATAMEIRSGI